MKQEDKENTLQKALDKSGITTNIEQSEKISRKEDKELEIKANTSKDKSVRSTSRLTNSESSLEKVFLCKSCSHPLEEHYIINQSDVISGGIPETECNHKGCNCNHYE